MSPADALALISAPPTDPRRLCHYVAASFRADAVEASALRQKFRDAVFSVVSRPGTVHLIAILAQPIPVERAFSAIAKLAQSIDLNCTGIAPNIGRSGSWKAPTDLTASELYAIAVTQAGEIDLKLAAGEIGRRVVLDPVCGTVATSAGPNILAMTTGG